MREMENFEKKSILKFEKNQLYDQREMKKIEICHEKLK
jgi:hypothetical protein